MPRVARPAGETRAGRLFGRFFAASREKLREAAERLNARHVANLAVSGPLMRS